MLDQYESLFRLVQAVGSLLVLLGGGYLFMWLRKYFPERGETVTPAALGAALEKQTAAITALVEKTDFASREAFNAAVGRAQTSFETQHSQLRMDLGELKESMVEAHRKAGKASEEALGARHLAELTQRDMAGLEKLMAERMDHLATLIKGGQGK